MTAQELKDWRLSLGLTKAEAAAMLRTPIETYRRWESGEKHCAAPGPLEIAMAAIARVIPQTVHR